MRWYRVYNLTCLFFSLLWASCDYASKPALQKINVEWSDGEIRQVLDPFDSTLKVFIFLAPECPLCINSSSSVNQLVNSFNSQEVRFFAVFPGSFYSVQEIKEFQSTYNLKLPGLYDTQNEIAKALKATVTPEAFLLNRNGEVVYSGAIDNRAFAPGKKRQTITDFYLKDAISAALAGQKPNPHFTEAIGCYIEF